MQFVRGAPGTARRLMAWVCHRAARSGSLGAARGAKRFRVASSSQRGPVVHAGDAAGSELLRRLTGSSQPRMPLSGPPFLDAAEITMVERWINAGLPAGSEIATRPAAAVPSLDEVVDYDFIRAIVHARIAQGHINLQETLCDDILNRLLEHTGVMAARVSTRKPDVYPDCEAVGVEAFRAKPGVL